MKSAKTTQFLGLSCCTVALNNNNMYVIRICSLDNTMQKNIFLKGFFTLGCEFEGTFDIFEQSFEILLEYSNF